MSAYDTSEDVAIVLCIDCLMLAANGETPHEYDEKEAADYLAVVDHNTRGYWATLGHDHDSDRCSHSGTECKEDCDCEQTYFSASQCGMCGTTLAGSREDATLSPAPYDGAAADRATVNGRRGATWNGNDRTSRYY